MADAAPEPVYIVADLLEVLCDMASDHEPARLTIPLATTSADELQGDPPTTGSVFTHLHLPATGRSVRAVFGVDLGTPAGTTPGVFITHPDGRAAVTKRDELREVVIIAVPPWRPEIDVMAFDRRGRRRRLEQVDVTLPEESPP